MGCHYKGETRAMKRKSRVPQRPRRNWPLSLSRNCEGFALATLMFYGYSISKVDVLLIATGEDFWERRSLRDGFGAHRACYTGPGRA
jgi:hypothetical protein